MNHEETHIINEETINGTQPEEKSSKGKTIATVGGSFVTGVVAGAVANASASVPAEEVTSEVEVSEETPDPEQVILANNQGIRYAHVNADNFSDAFVQARDQVGPGGVFEYNGKLYNTYYADEWENMSNQERADYQNRVNEVAPSSHHSVTNNVAEHHENVIEEIPANDEMIEVEPVSEKVRVLGVEAVQNEDGSVMNIALLESGDDNALMVDIDNDGVIDILLHDDNGDGELQPSEIHDISEAGIEVNDLIEAQVTSNEDYPNFVDDDMSDFMNDDMSLKFV